MEVDDDKSAAKKVDSNTTTIPSGIVDETAVTDEDSPVKNSNKEWIYFFFFTNGEKSTKIHLFLNSIQVHLFVDLVVCSLSTKLGTGYFSSCIVSRTLIYITKHFNKKNVL